MPVTWNNHLATADKFLSAETQASIFSMSIQQVKEWDLIMGDLCISRWQTGEAKRARKMKKARELHQNTWKKKSCFLVGEFLQTSYCTGSSVAQWSSAPERTAEWAEMLTGVELFYWPLRSFFGSAAKLKYSLGWSTEEGAAASKTSPKYPFVPQSLNAERPAWMSLLCAAVHHGKMPNRTMDWANNNTTPLRLCLPGHLSRLAFCSFFSFNRISSGKKKSNKLLVSDQSGGVLFLGWLLNCNSNTVTSAGPRH